MFEFDFHPVASTTGEGTTKSGDAITGRFIDDQGVQRVIVIDAGYQATGETVVEHIRKYYGTSRVDLAISTHPDADHINGMSVVLEELAVGELLIHRPRLHAGPLVSLFSNIETVDNLLNVALDNDTLVSDPFTGAERFDGQVKVLGPEKDFYSDLVAEHLAAVASGTKSVSLSASLRNRAGSLLESVLDWLPVEETLTDAGETNPRNETSVITLITVGAHRLLLTGDAGQRSLTRVVEEYESLIGPFATYPLRLFQAPHHGSRRNIGPTLLNRILGERGMPHSDTTSAIISAAKDNPKHPSPKVTNALLRRGAFVAVTAGQTVCSFEEAPVRSGWGPISPMPPLDEGADDDV